MPAEEIASARIPVTPTTYQELKDFRSGLDMTFDGALYLMMQLLKSEGEDAFTTGRRLRDAWEKSQQNKQK